MTEERPPKNTAQVEPPSPPRVGTGGPAGPDAAHAYRCKQCGLEFVRPSKTLTRVMAAILGAIGIAVFGIIPYLMCTASLPPTRAEVGPVVFFGSMPILAALIMLLSSTWLYCPRCKSRSVVLLERPVTLLQELRAREPERYAKTSDLFGYVTGGWVYWVVGLIVFLIMGSLIAAAAYHHYYG